MRSTYLSYHRNYHTHHWETYNTYDSIMSNIRLNILPLCHHTEFIPLRVVYHRMFLIRRVHDMPYGGRTKLFEASYFLIHRRCRHLQIEMHPVLTIFDSGTRCKPISGPGPFVDCNTIQPSMSSRTV